MTTGSVAQRFALESDFGMPNRLEFRAKLMQAIDAGATELVIDATTCGYIDSSGMGVLVSCAKRCRELGGKLTLEHVTPDVREYLKLTMLDRIIDVAAP